MWNPRPCAHTDLLSAAHAGVRVEACAPCATVRFCDAGGDDGDQLEATVALAKLFGTFDLIGTLDAVRAPGRTVLMYRAPDRLTHASLRVVTPHQWFEADDGLWLYHDGEHLLLSHNHRLASDLVGAHTI